MMRIILGVIGGLIIWAIVWFGNEKLISALWPAFGSHQSAFQAAIENGGEFTANPIMLLVHIPLASVASLTSGVLAAMIAGENKRSPLILGFLLLAFGLVKAAMSWPYVPVWYHLLFTAILLPLAVVGGRSKDPS